MSLRPIGWQRGVAFGDANQCWAEQPLVIGVTGQEDLGDCAGGTIAALDLEQRLVAMRVKRFAGHRLNFLDAMLNECIPKCPFGQSDPGQ